MVDDFLGLDEREWGLVGVAANLVSVSMQFWTLVSTKNATSFSPTFIGFMTLLNAWYAFVAFLHDNIPFMVSALVFTAYNIVVLAVYFTASMKKKQA